MGKIDWKLITMIAMVIVVFFLFFVMLFIIADNEYMTKTGNIKQIEIIDEHTYKFNFDDGEQITCHIYKIEYLDLTNKSTHIFSFSRDKYFRTDDTYRLYSVIKVDTL